jgi:protein TonB
VPAPGEPSAPAGTATIPELIPSTKVAPVFPPQALEKVAKGQVILQAVVRKDGTLGDFTVLRSTACDCGFEAAALAAVAQWRYKPAAIDGEPVEIYFTIEVNFKR